MFYTTSELTDGRQEIGRCSLLWLQETFIYVLLIQWLSRLSKWLLIVREVVNKKLFGFGMRVSLRKDMGELKMGTENREGAAAMENCEAESVWYHCFKCLELQQMGCWRMFLITCYYAYGSFIQLIFIEYLLHASTYSKCWKHNIEQSS